MKILRPIVQAVAGVVGGAVLATSLVACVAPSPVCACAPAAVTMPASKGEPVVLAVAGHRNAPPSVVSASMRAAVEHATDTHAAVGVISVDGDPRLVRAGVYAASAGNDAANNANQKSFVEGVIKTVGGVTASAPHVDNLAALRVSAAAVRSSRASGGVVFLEDSGLSDTGSLDFSRGALLQAAPDDVVQFLRHHHALPDLTGIRVVLVGIGDTAPPQAPLAQSDRDNLVAVYEAVVTAAGAASVTVDPTPVQTPPRTTPRADLPDVAITPVPRPDSFDQIRNVGRGTGSTVVTLADAGPIGFVGDRTVLRDPTAAAAQLDALAGQLLTLPSAHVALLGTTSSAGDLDAAGDRDRADLSRRRAGVIRTELIQRGVPASWFMPVQGNGYHFAGYVEDRADDGSLLPGPAAQNRSVRVTVTAG